jgi:signal transduction histidine kinase
LAINVQDLFPVGCTFRCPHVVEIANPAVATHLYRIAQEACNNAIKHGRAKQIDIELARSADDDVLTLTVADDGVGFAEPTGATKGMGMQIMRYRAAAIGGSIGIRANGAAGTVIAFQCRLTGQEPAAAV